MTIDSFYTPPELAKTLVSFYGGQTPKLVADFTAGDGALLKAAVEKWGAVGLIAADLSSAAITILKQKFPKAVLIEMDFLEFRDSTLERRPDLVLLNPPFTCRGNAFRTSVVEGGVVRSSTAMAFVLKALETLPADGEILAILPKSCLTSQKDVAAREYIERSWALTVLTASIADAFEKCSVTIDLVRISKKSNIGTSNSTVEPSTVIPFDRPYQKVFVRRGSIPFKKGITADTGNILVHTTNIKTFADDSIPLARNESGKVVNGRAVLLPRVGRPDLSKIVIKAEHIDIVLSDCVFAVSTYPSGYEADLLAEIQNNWATLKSYYIGSCAPYITIAGLKSFFHFLGITATHDTEQPTNLSLWAEKAFGSGWKKVATGG